MHLSEDDTRLFYKIFFRILDYVNEKKQVVPELGKMYGATELDPNLVAKVAQCLWENDSLIDSFLQESSDLDEEEAEILRGWKKHITGDFFIERHLKSGSAFIGENDQVFMVSGISEDLEEDFWGVDLPVLVTSTLIPFKGVIITDGLNARKNVFFGGGVKSMLKETYLKAKSEGRIIKSLDSDPENSSRAAARQKNTNGASARRAGKKKAAYTLKIYPRGRGREVYRVMNISPNSTLADLAESILAAFGFQQTYLFEFCMDNKAYSRNWSACIESESKDIHKKISTLNLSVGQKFLFHNDFADDWQFQITVQKIIEGEDVTYGVIKAKGEIEDNLDYDYFDEW